MEETRRERAEPLVDGIFQAFGTITPQVADSIGLKAGMTRDQVLKHFDCASKANQRGYLTLYKNAAGGELGVSKPKALKSTDKDAKNETSLSDERYQDLYALGYDNFGASLAGLFAFAGRQKPLSKKEEEAIIFGKDDRRNGRAMNFDKNRGNTSHDHGNEVQNSDVITPVRYEELWKFAYQNRTRSIAWLYLQMETGQEELSAVERAAIDEGVRGEHNPPPIPE